MATYKAGCLNVFVIVFYIIYLFSATECRTGKKEKRSVGQSTMASAYTNINNQPPMYFYNGYLPQNSVLDPNQNPFIKYFQFMNEPGYPPEILLASNNVLSYLSNTQLNYSPILASMQGLQGLGIQDQLVGLLLKIQRELPIHCNIKSDISKLILYNMMRSYLSYVPLLDGTFPDTFGIYHPTGENVVNYREIIKHLINKLRCCERKKEGEVRTEVKYIEKSAEPKIEVRYLEKPTPPPQVITEIKYVEKPCPTLPSLPPTTTPAPTEGPFKKLLEAIPNPNNGFEKMKYETISNFLNRQDLNHLLAEVDLSTASSDEDRLNLLLSKSATLELEQPVIDAIKYYLNYAKNMSALNLYTQKEIRKHFELTKIFTDTLDFENLSMEGRLSFDAFYNFLLGVTGEQMKNFDTWSDVKTRGEFMHVLFEYFLSQEFVPVNIKEAISFLKPLIKMTGSGATPP